jgi:simple sugar transport system substrate-binding protein
MNSRVKRFISILAALLVVFGLTLGIVGQTNAQAKRLKLVVVAHGGPGNPFWVTVIKGANDAAKLFGVDFQWLSPNNDDVQGMVKYMDDAVAAKPDGVGITAPNPDIIRDDVNKLAAAGVPILILNTNDPNAADPDKRLPVMFYLGTSEFIAGQSNARAALRAAKAAGKPITHAMCIVQTIGHTALEARCKGYADVMTAAGVKVDTIPGDPQADKEGAIIADYMKANPDVTAINTLGPNPATGFYIWARDAKIKPGEFFHTNHDLGNEILDNIKAGLTIQTVDQQPYYQGFGTVEWLWLKLNYEIQPGGDILTGPSYVDKTNVDKVIQLVKDGYR